MSHDVTHITHNDHHHQTDVGMHTSDIARGPLSEVCAAQYQRYGDTWPHSVYVFHWPDLYNACIVYNVCIHTDASVHKKLSTQGINRCWSSGHLISRKHSEEPIKVYQPFPDCFLDPYNISSPSHFVSPPLKGSLPLPPSTKLITLLQEIVQPKSFPSS